MLGVIPASEPAAPCQNVWLMPSKENIELVREAILCLVNQVREGAGEPALTVNEQLLQAAQSHSERMISENYFNHIAPDGETPLARVEATGYIPAQNSGYIIGENVAWGIQRHATPQAIVEAWVASPDHLANILEAKYRETAIGVEPSVPASLSGGEPGATYTQEFAVIKY
jgi:uncharacterized protein YkwD